MKTNPRWQTALVIYLIYNLIIFGTWAAAGVDYNNMVGGDVAGKSIVLPLVLGAIFLIPTLTWLGWWRPVMTETNRGRPQWVIWLILASMVGFIVVNAATTNWSALTSAHLLLLIAGGILVGFNEEVLNRGILVVGWRGSTNNEAWVWFWSTLLFGLLHLPNGFFGPGFASSSIQVAFAFLAGSGFYVIRRLSGTLLIPMVLHGAWDFVSFCNAASGGTTHALKVPFQVGTYLLSIVLAIVILLAGRRSRD